MKILFLTHHFPNYVPDILLHGLRKLMGPDVVEYPRKDCLYSGVLGLGVCSENQPSPGWFPPDNGHIDRENIDGKINKGYFDYIVCDIRAVSIFSNPSGKVVLIDGEDKPAKVIPGQHVICRRETDGSDYSIPLPMAMPEEIFKWISSHDGVNKKFSIGFLGSASQGERKVLAETISKLYPDSLFKVSMVPTGSEPVLERRMSRDEYYQSVQSCRMLLSLSGSGHDTFRFWENTACNAVHIASKMPLFIPDDFLDGEHIFRFRNIDELRRVVDRILDEKVKAEEIIEEGRNHLLNFHLSTKRAIYFLDRIKQAF